MQLGNIVLGADLMDVLLELRSQLYINQINLLKDIKDSGDNIQVTCPFHKDGNERKPSCGIHKVTLQVHCFTCHTTMLLDEFISYCFGRNDGGIFGKQWLIKNFATIEIEDRQEIQLDLSRKSKAQPKKEYVSEEELDKYRYYHPYWTKRGITNESLIELFDLGYDVDAKCVTFPCRDIKGNCLFVARRSINTKWFNYPRNAEKPIYGAYELTQVKEYPKEVIICESMLDALSVWQFGRYAIALNGTGSESQFEILNKLPIRKYILATDMDEAGKKARNILRKRLKNKVVTELVWDVNKAKDINDMSKEVFDSLKEIL